LDGVPGLGQARRTALIKQFGSVKKLKQASVEDIATVPGVGRRTAEAVHAALAGSDATGAGARGEGETVS
jgi:excinuclease ABC subunit C